MQKRSIQRGRPLGATTFDAELAHALGTAVRALRTERGEHMPTLAIIFKIAGALECSTAVLMTKTESQLTEGKI